MISEITKNINNLKRKKYFGSCSVTCTLILEYNFFCFKFPADMIIKPAVFLYRTSGKQSSQNKTFSLTKQILKYLCLFVSIIYFFINYEWKNIQLISKF